MESFEANREHNSSQRSLCSQPEDRFLQFWIELAAESTCVVSILGSIATMASYLALKEMRHRVRELLLHLSIMTFVCSAANLVGSLLNYRKHLCAVSVDGRVVYPSSYNTYHHVCQVQAFFTSYGTIGSAVWSLGLVVYLYYRTLPYSGLATCVTKSSVVRLSYPLFYILPLYASLWLLLDGWLGYAPWSPTHKGWCAMMAVEANGTTHPVELFMTDDMWIMLSAMMITVVTLRVHVQISDQVMLYYSV